MLNWMREITANCLLGNEFDGEDFHLGFDVGLPAEVQSLLSGKNPIKISQLTKATCDYENSAFILDEHELAMG